MALVNVEVLDAKASTARDQGVAELKRKKRKVTWQSLETQAGTELQ